MHVTGDTSVDCLGIHLQINKKDITQSKRGAIQTHYLKNAV